MPIDFSDKATNSAEPPNTALPTAYDNPTPNARTSGGNISALIKPLIEVYKLIIAIPRITRTKAAYGFDTSLSAYSSGTVQSVASPPNQSMEVRRPILSDSAPNK